MPKTFPAAFVAAAFLTLAACSSGEKESGAPAASAPAPAIYKINFDTTRGAMVVEIHRDWSPRGADHLYELVKTGFYDGDRFFRVVRDFVAQFGINGDPAKNHIWENTPLQDDPVAHPNSPGTLTFASRGPNSRTTQLFFNLRDNSASLDGRGFSPMGVIISGMDVMEGLYAGYGEMAPNGAGPDPAMIQQQGTPYLESKFPHLDYIKKATIQ